MKSCEKCGCYIPIDFSACPSCGAIINKNRIDSIGTVINKNRVDNIQQSLCYARCYYKDNSVY